MDFKNYDDDSRTLFASRRKVFLFLGAVAILLFFFLISDSFLCSFYATRSYLCSFQLSFQSVYGSSMYTVNYDYPNSTSFTGNLTVSVTVFVVQLTVRKTLSRTTR